MEAAALKSLCVVCLSLGTPSSSRVSRYQLGLLSLLLSRMQNCVEVQVYDPVLGETDAKLLGGFGYSCIAPPEAAAQHTAPVGSFTLFFMPHCDLELYEAVLRANWPQCDSGAYSGLRRLAILGNSLSAYADRVVDRGRYGASEYVEKASRQCREIPIADGFGVSGVFNNLSLHIFTHCD